MASDNRPLSPHLQIYRPQLTSVLSIAHRGAGVALGVGAAFFAWWLLAAASGPEAYGTAQAFFGSVVGIVVLAGFTFALFYHLCNGSGTCSGMRAWGWSWTRHTAPAGRSLRRPSC